jgi:hypothetical protein
LPDGIDKHESSRWQQEAKVSEEVFIHAQGEWSTQFPGVEIPKSKTDIVKQYYQAVRDSVYVHIIDIESEGNWVMEDSTQSNTVL